MARRKQPKYRWALDSSVIIALIKGNDVIRGKPAGVYSRALFERAEQGEAILVISGIALVEVYKPHPKAAPFSPPGDFIRIEEFFSKSYIELVEVGRECGKLARTLALEEGIPSWDAVHVAAAILGEAECLYCWDKDHLLSRRTIRGLELREPPASVIPGPQPPELRQTAFLESTRNSED